MQNFVKFGGRARISFEEEHDHHHIWFLFDFIFDIVDCFCIFQLYMKLFLHII